MADIPSGSAPAAPAAPASPAPAIAAPVSGGSPSPVQESGDSTQPSGGEPPRERWNDILDNARRKTRAEVDQEYRQRYSQYEQFETDPWAAVQGWLRQASEHSLYGPVVKQYFRERAGQQPEAEPKPDTPIVDASGQITGYTYSDKALRQWQGWNEQKLRAEFDQRFGSLEQQNAQRVDREERAQMQQEAFQNAGQTLGGLRRQPYFTEHEPAIKQALVDHPEWGDNVHAAYNHVLVTQILPTLSQAEQRQVVNALTGKAAGTTVAPGGTAPAAPKFKSFRAAAEYYSQHPEEAEAMANRQ